MGGDIGGGLTTQRAPDDCKAEAEQAERDGALDRLACAVAACPTPTPVACLRETLLDGLITNGKFCCVRRMRLSLTWWHRPLRLRRSALHPGAALVGEPHDPGPGPSAASPARVATANAVGIRPTSCWCA